MSIVNEIWMAGRDRLGSNQLVLAKRKNGKGTEKCGAESSDPNRHSQPRLPGSVVGEVSMGQARKRHKITKVSVPR